MVLCHGGEKDATIPASALEEKRVEEAVRRLETQKKDLFFFKKKFLWDAGILGCIPEEEKMWI